MSKKLKNIGIISLLTIVSRVLGLVRDSLSASIFGASVFMDAFITAYRLPNLFRRLLGEGSLATAFVPSLQEELRENGRAGAYVLLSQVTSWLTVAAGSCVAIGMLVFSQSHLIAGQDAKWHLAANLTVWLFPYLLFVCLAAAFSAVLNVFERFAEPALSPIWLNLCWIAALGAVGLNFADTELGRIHWLCAGVLVGGFLQMAVPAAVLIREGWRPRIDLTLSPRVRTIAAWMAPGLFGTAIYQLNVYISGLFAFSINESAATLLFYANRLMEFPIGVFAIAVSTVVYPLIARHAAEKNYVSMAEDYRKGLRLILIINVPAAAGLALLSVPIVRLLFQHGKFTPEMAQAMSPLLALFVIGMPFFSIVSLTTRAFYSIKDTVTPVKIAALSFIVNLGLSWSLKDVIGAPGLVVASTVAIVIQTLMMQHLLARALPGMQFGDLWRTIGKVILATLAMAAIVGGGWHFLQGRFTHARSADLIAVLGLIPIGVAVYAAILVVLKIEGREAFAALSQKIFKRAG
ncbi:MAG: integral rane protein MviN [Verrucomicrobia bacterium]|nr:integral rane protein MviN [Verrucomicrobiota bacterium]